MQYRKIIYWLSGILFIAKISYYLLYFAYGVRFEGILHYVFENLIVASATYAFILGSLLLLFIVALRKRDRRGQIRLVIIVASVLVALFVIFILIVNVWLGAPAKEMERKVGQLNLGMSMAEVESIMGSEPDDISRRDSTYEIWNYPPPQKCSDGPSCRFDVSDYRLVEVNWPSVGYEISEQPNENDEGR